MPNDKDWPAINFDKPIDSAEHQMLLKDLWLVGGLHNVRYWLGRLCDRNLYRESDENVISELRMYFVQREWNRAIGFCSEPGCWNSVSDVLRLHVYKQIGSAPPDNLREAKATEQFLLDPEVTDEALAEELNTTVNQIAKLASLRYMRLMFHRLLAAEGAG